MMGYGYEGMMGVGRRLFGTLGVSHLARLANCREFFGNLALAKNFKK